MSPRPSAVPSRDAWASARGLTPSLHGAICLCQLFGDAGCDFPATCPLALPVWDHPSLWTRNGRLDTLVIQPHSDVTCDHLRELADVAERAGLILEAGPAWHRRAVLLAFRVDDDALRHDRDADREQARLAGLRRARPWLGSRDGLWCRRAADGCDLAVIQRGRRGLSVTVWLPEAHQADPVAVLRGLVPPDGAVFARHRARTFEAARAFADLQLEAWGYRASGVAAWVAAAPSWHGPRARAIGGTP